VTRSEKVASAIWIVAIIGAAWLYRYELEVSGGAERPALGYMLDRWTGRVYFLSPNYVRELKPEQSSASVLDLDETK
jgi:hypothetical protein